ncbi:MAG: ATP-dependent DNA helicase RecG [Chitinophagales bacterium]|nr:ATP-dependent DNA helicase RecG [Chitinophagales bacterium]
MSRFLEKPVEYLKGVGPQRADLLKKELQIFTYKDLLFHFPFRYVDRSRIYQIGEVNSDQFFIQIKGKLSPLLEAGHKRASRLIAHLKDDTGSMELVWFKGVKWVQKTLVPGVEYIAFGKPVLFNGKYNIPHPEMEPATEVTLEKLKGMQPMYNSTEKLKSHFLDSKGLGKIIRAAILEMQPQDLPEILPSDIVSKYRFPSRFQAFRDIHMPYNERQLELAKQRIKYEELFLIQIRMLAMKHGRRKQFQGFMFEKIDGLFDTFYKTCLKFDLTNAQKRVLKEIRRDVVSGSQMNRLLQGDVGSGKTIVALMTMLMAHDNGYQAALMAPTEILAQQHLQTLTEYIGQLPLRVELLTSNVKGKQRKAVLEDLAAGHIDIIIGTHALIEETVQFRNLGCVVIDEQHRFGVAQRARLWEKNAHPPHILVMTATPIPRTLAMTLYGDLDVSVIDELPPGRKPIVTQHRYDSNRLKVFQFMKDEIAKGRQVYVVYPLIKESEKLDLKDLEDGYESITRAFPLPDYRVSIVHGKMKAEDKEAEMQRFVKGQTHIMVATTVIEVGVNVPNASIMVIENAERFGLAQLHQLRGRVGRGAEQSYCILMSSNKLTNDARARIDTMVRTNDGFEIAETDLQLRGPGDMEGTQQSGVLNLLLADIGKDANILQAARKDAEEVLQADPGLNLAQNQPLLKHLARIYKDQPDWSKIS